MAHVRPLRSLGSAPTFHVVCGILSYIFELGKLCLIRCTIILSQTCFFCSIGDFFLLNKILDVTGTLNSALPEWQ